MASVQFILPGDKGFTTSSESALAASSVAVGPPGDDPLWYLISNERPDLNLKLTDVHAFSYNRPWQQGVHEIASRKKKVVEKSIYGPWGIEGNLTALLHELDEDNEAIGYPEIQRKLNALKDLIEESPDLTLADNQGNAWDIQIGDNGLRVEMQDDDHGRVEVSFEFTEV